eukprot:Skav204797  [mRNA]  locus=scaffold763:452964:459404:+ [translate_table: standard]
MASTASAHVFVNGRWSSQMVSFTLEVDSSPTADDAVLLVKSTFLEFGDGLSLQKRFRQIRKASTDPIFDKDSYYQIYEPGVDKIDLRDPRKNMEDIEISEMKDSSSEGRKDSKDSETPQVEEKAERIKGKREKPKTTVMLRNLPNNYTRSMLLQLLNEQGFLGKYDFFYLPMDFDRKANLGYAFVNLVSADHVDEFWRIFHGFGSWSFPSSKVCNVSWSGPKQGLKAHVDRYKNSPVMHKSVPEEYKPMIFSDGVPKRFPAPTIRVQHPKKAGTGKH